MIRTEEITIVITETHPKVSTLQADIRKGRKVGNTTRQKDFAIDKLFQGYVVVVRDHYNNGECRKANEALFRLLLERLDEEHNVAGLILAGKLVIDFNNLTLEII